MAPSLSLSCNNSDKTVRTLSPTYPPLYAIGLMSGTSLDGVDIALLHTNGEALKKLGPSLFLAYTRQQRAILTQATREARQWAFDEKASPNWRKAQNCLDNAHINAVQQFLASHNLTPDNIDLIGYHGQTLLHRAPTQNAKGRSLQIGDGQKLAQAVGIDVIYDFRQNDISHGGHGAPLAPIYHKALCAYHKLLLPCLILNIGGVANFTYIDEGVLIASDCGPGNGLLDEWIYQHTQELYDEGGKISAQGTIDEGLVQNWLKRDFFTRKWPKSADRWDFDILSDLNTKSLADGAATLCAFTTLAITQAVKALQKKGLCSPKKLIISGGGRHNKTLLKQLTANLPQIAITAAHEIGISGDDMEAQAFAYLAVRSHYKLPLSFTQTTNAPFALTGGTLARV